MYITSAKTLKNYLHREKINNDYLSLIFTYNMPTTERSVLFSMTELQIYANNDIKVCHHIELICLSHFSLFYSQNNNGIGQGTLLL